MVKYYLTHKVPYKLKRAGTSVELWVNGQKVPDSRVGKKAVLADRQVAGYDYIGVDLVPGNNTLEVRQLDGMGNLREKTSITVAAPDQLKQLLIDTPKQEVQANGKDIYQAVLKLQDANGVAVSSRTPVTLLTSAVTLQLKDLDPNTPGVQVFVEGGSLVVPIQAPAEPTQAKLVATSGIFSTSRNITFLPNLRPLIATGIIEGAINLRHFDPSALGKVDRRDGFEEELHDIASSSDGKRSVTGRAALFLKGKVKGTYLLTLAYDSDKNSSQLLFRDIRPDEYYPVYGDAAAKGFDAQSTSKLYVRVDKGRSYVLYGDYVTRTENDEGISLGQYSRSLTGLKTSVEDEKSKVTGFVARTNATQVVNEQRGLLSSRGITQLLNAGATYDINERWDAGINTGVMWNDATSGYHYLLGGEVGYLLAQNLWLSAGYNVAGYKDEDLVDSNTTAQGPYLRLRFKFDENLFKTKKDK